jgi:Alpha/beta hydrolase of unknown function (DUF900)
MLALLSTDLRQRRTSPPGFIVTLCIFGATMERNKMTVPIPAAVTTSFRYLSATLSLCRLLAMVALIAVTVGSCGRPNAMFAGSEAQYDLDTFPVFDSNLRIYHSALLDPAGIHLDAGGYVVGVEKVGGFFGHREVTHVIQYGGDNGLAQRAGRDSRNPCILFSELIAGYPSTSEEHRLIKNQEPMSECSGVSSSSTYRQLLFNSLKRRLISNSEGFTHIFVMVMGWNTDQEEAVKNYNEITNNLRNLYQENERPFNPLVIGITWPSEWLVGDWIALPGALVRGASFPIKKDQADRVGQQFVYDILTTIILPIRANQKTKLPIVLIGHSFGARALAAMFHSQDGWQSSFKLPASTGFTFDKNDRLILLEGAFDISYLFDDEKNILPALKESNIITTLTSSSVDTAFNTAIWANYAGDHRTFRTVCRRSGFAVGYHDLVGCGQAVRPDQWGLGFCNKTPDSAAEEYDPPAGVKVRYFDASRLINCQTPFGGGGAHDDFNRPEMARFLFSEITDPR